MASTTKTTTLAQTGTQPRAGHMPVTITHSWNATSLSASACAVGLLCKIPVGAKNVHLGWSAVHTGATGAKLQFGYRNQDGSVTASAVVALADIAVTTTTAWSVQAAVADPVWTESVDGGTNQFKYLQVSVGSGTASAGFVLDWQLTYDF